MNILNFLLDFKILPLDFVQFSKYLGKIIKQLVVQTTLRVVENFGSRVFSTTESFSTIESAQNFKAKLYFLLLVNMKWTITIDDDYYLNQTII